MTNSNSAIAAWINKFNAEVTLYNNQIAATTAEHNARYVNGAGSGQLWIDKDAADLAAYNAEVTLYNGSQTALASMTTDRNAQAAALASMTADRNAQVVATAAATPPALDVRSASATCAADGARHNNVANTTADRTGQWVVIWRCTSTSGTNNSIHVSGYAGASAEQIGEVNATPAYNTGAAAVWQGPLNNGDTLRTDAQGVGGGTLTARVDAYFIPTPAYPH